MNAQTEDREEATNKLIVLVKALAREAARNYFSEQQQTSSVDMQPGAPSNSDQRLGGS